MAIALSIRHPWIELILEGRKTIEVRSWRTKYRGPLLLHASRTIDNDACSRFGIQPNKQASGAIIGVVDLIDCRQFTYETWQELFPAHLNVRDFDKGLMGWIVDNPRRVDPTPLPGRLGLFAVPDYEVSEPIARFASGLGPHRKASR